MTTIPVAVQMFTLREESEKDFAGTLKKVAELGFDGVEFAGYGGLDVKEVRALLDEYGLKAAASHVGLDQLQNNLDQVIEEQKILGSEYVVCPYLLEDQRNEESYKALIPFLEEAGEKCRQEGLTLCYHNHDFELEKLSDGRFALQAIFEDTTPENVQAEFDVYWLTKAGENPVEWIERYKDRTPLIHLKDMTTDEEQFFAELGTGGVNIEAVMEAGKEIGAKWFVVEQDATRKTPFESIEISINYLKTKLPHLAAK
ncbi:sugar phosphate isomerase/epimerase family protein [Pseudogracilibacillus auburnensis]|uniref:sugar phosphate isomerase/epimerase family protein n=1 Tax=Pseudogracilibacillus auburnensis TaxID=1494959 RepID=UPI001A9636BD|nr:sugar phosphate isomerase/epimerase [Pseudogracilibacillus auburnensis]MBO1005324.1 sugar phosphate isomerase/epimerase [Pseudogracilibacillus auburnensis]